MFYYVAFCDCICILQECNAFICLFFWQLCALYIVFLRCDAYVFMRCGTVFCIVATLIEQSFGAPRLDNLRVFSVSWLRVHSGSVCFRVAVS